MQKYRNSIQNQFGAPVANVTVTVKVAAIPPGTGANATIYSDDGTSIISTSQVATDSHGEFSFYAPDGRYDLLIAGTGVESRTISDVEIADVTEKFASGDAPWVVAAVQTDSLDTLALSINGSPIASTNLSDSSALVRATDKNVANGVAGLDATGQLSPSVVPSSVEQTVNKGVASGYAPLDDNALLPEANLPASVQLTSQKGVANGYASLDASGLVPVTQLPGGSSSGAELQANKDVANGYAGLDASAKLKSTEIPFGTTAGTVAAGDDSRITGAQQTTGKNANSGYCGLDAGGHVADAQLPDKATAGTYTKVTIDAKGRVTTGATVATADLSDGSTIEKTTRKGTANGYASLDGNTRVPSAQLGSGTADATTFLRGDGAWATAGGAGGGADPTVTNVWTANQLYQLADNTSAITIQSTTASSSNSADIELKDNQATAQSFFLRKSSNTFKVLNNAKSSVLTVDDGGVLNAVGGIQVNGSSLALNNLSDASTVITTAKLNVANGAAGLDSNTHISPDQMQLGPVATDGTTITKAGAVTTDQILRNTLIPAGSFNTVGRSLRVTGGGVLSTGTSAPTLTFKLIFDGVVTLASCTLPLAASLSAVAWYADFTVVLTANGTSSTLHTTGTVVVNSATAGSPKIQAAYTTATGVNLTVDQTIEFVVDFSVASSSNSITQNVWTVMRLGN